MKIISEGFEFNLKKVRLLWLLSALFYLGFFFLLCYGLWSPGFAERVDGGFTFSTSFFVLMSLFALALYGLGALAKLLTFDSCSRAEMLSHMNATGLYGFYMSVKWFVVWCFLYFTSLLFVGSSSLWFLGIVAIGAVYLHFAVYQPSEEEALELWEEFSFKYLEDYNRASLKSTFEEDAQKNARHLRALKFSWLVLSWCVLFGWLGLAVYGWFLFSKGKFAWGLGTTPLLLLMHILVGIAFLSMNFWFRGEAMKAFREDETDGERLGLSYSYRLLNRHVMFAFYMLLILRTKEGAFFFWLPLLFLSYSLFRFSPKKADFARLLDEGSMKRCGGI